MAHKSLTLCYFQRWRSFAAQTLPELICCWNGCCDPFPMGVYISSKNASCWCCVCVIQQKRCLWNKVSLRLCVLLVWFKANKYKFETHNKSDLNSNWTFPLRGMKSNYCCVTVLKYSVFLHKNVYCVSLAKKKKACSMAFEFFIKVSLCQISAKI